MIRRLPLSLRVYRRFTATASPFVPVLLAARLRRGKEHAKRMAERRGEAGLPRPQGPLIWIHGASVGELLAAFSLIGKLRAQDLQVLVTTGTVTSATLAHEKLPAGVLHQFVPIDTPRFVSRFLRHWRPSLGLFIESDLWPNLVLSSAKSRVPMILINGRMSERSFDRWQLFPRTAQALLGSFDLCLAQSALDGERFSKLGSANVQVTGNLKLDVPAPGADDQQLAALRTAIGARPVIVAASTHPGEERICFDVHRRLRQAFPGLLTIIVPRHATRGPEILAEAAAVGLPAQLRTQRPQPDAANEVYIADTMGEMGLFYRLGRVVFMGKSLTTGGGQNPIEAARLGLAIVHGPLVGNFLEIYAALDAAHGAVEVANGDELALQIARWFKDDKARTAAADMGLKTVNRLGGALERTLASLDPYLLQLRLEQRSDET